MKKRTYLLRNRIIQAVLIAVLAQSLFFGMLLVSQGGVSAIARQPYETMRLRLQDKNDVVSGTLNQIYLEGIGLKRQIWYDTEKENIHTMLVDVLNKTKYLSAILYVNLAQNEGVGYIDAEPAEYSLNSSDIACFVGDSHASMDVGMSNKWSRSFNQERYRKVLAFAEQTGSIDGWFYDEESKAFYYTVYLMGDEDRHLILLQVEEPYLERLFKEESTGADNMQFYLGSSDGHFYGEKEKGCQVTVGERYSGNTQEIEWINDRESYTGYRERLKLYGEFHRGGGLYIQVLGKDSRLQAPAYELMHKIITAYVFSIIVCFVACWSATGIVLKPLKKLLKDIQEQRGREVHFKDSRAVEIQSIYTALNDMAKRLEESHSRYRFTMEGLEHNIGSFLYHEDTALTDITASVEEILCIPKEYISEDMEMPLENWEKLKQKLCACPELNAYTFTDSEGDVHCVSIKLKKEECGTFGVVMDKTAEYQKISHLRFVSEHDSLTRLYNASYLKEQGTKLLAAHKNQVNAMMFCDLDNLKYVNDHYGHSMGDAYIVAMADRMQWCVKELQEQRPAVDVIAARISGDEFAMLFTGFSSREEIREVLIRLYQRKCFICLEGEEEYSVRVSIGFAYEDKKAKTIDRLLKCADEAMYSIKSKSKNGIAVYISEGQMKEIDIKNT